MKLYAGGYLTFYLPNRSHTLEIHLPAPAPLKDVLTGLRIPLEEVHLVALNGELADLETVVVRETDAVRIFSSVNGG